LLVNAGADVHLTDDDGRSPLAWATLLMNSEAIIFLSEAGAKVNTKDKKGYTPLRSAARLKMDDVVVSSLVGAGADITSSNYESHYAQSTIVESEKMKIR
jgi:ankyrin repeat protein